MIHYAFIAVLAILFTLLLGWCFKYLPGERWQIMASVPVKKISPGEWQGVNVTYYGLLNANAYTLAVSILFILTGAVGVPTSTTLIMVFVILLCCMPASRILARLIEKKAYTFTVGGASFVGLLIAPLVLWIVNSALNMIMTDSLNPMPFMAAMAVAYAFGEGAGRLACISFGCCYGKPLSQCNGSLQRMFRHCSFVFSGKTKKIAYESGLDGQKVVPIQAVTAVLYIGIGLVGTHLFLQALFIPAFLLAVLGTQGWRVVSETLRADYRGGGRMTAYQVMSLGAMVYAVFITAMTPAVSVTSVDVMDGLRSFWQPGVILFLFFLWFFSFIYTGRSRVTGSLVSVYVHRDRI